MDNSIIQHLRQYVGKDRKQVRNPCITANEAIVIANYIDELERRAARVQGEPSSGVPEGFREQIEQLVLTAYYSTDEEDNTVNADDLRAGIDRLMTALTATPTPETGQSGGVPDKKLWSQVTGRDGKMYTDGWNDAIEAVLASRSEVKAVGVIEYADHQNADALTMGAPLRMAVAETSPRSVQSLSKGTKLYTHPHNGEQGGEWVRCDERLPTEADEDERGDVWLYEEAVGPILCAAKNLRACPRLSRPLKWKPTGLTRPQPPKSKEGE
ncbi:hypothetical protein [Marinobacter nauticus]|uniref:Uncharacterized protein n=1 Tax=Marinobacter nauticus TaxID=2743 RepID=A0A833JQA9_MARNT|nr:hypothetical protein [Marinobacter nauticus]KAE8546119.1 hypothetical protein F6453_1365 [Marinobacter nauticus]